MNLGQRGSELIKSFERLRLEAYLPTPDDVPTIGWGHIKGVRMGQVITEAAAEQYFRSDVLPAERIVNQLQVKLTQAMFDSLVSLAFNAGTLGETIPKALRAGDYFTAWHAFGQWRKQAGKDLLGLARRRAREMQLYLEDGLPK
jgi:lysozyme